MQLHVEHFLNSASSSNVSPKHIKAHHFHLSSARFSSLRDSLNSQDNCGKEYYPVTIIKFALNNYLALATYLIDVKKI